MTYGPRVVHVIAEFSSHEAMGRTVTETARRVPGEHHVVTTRAHDGADAFASMHELGGRVATFPVGRTGALAGVLDGLRPDLVHLHAGALGPLQAALTVLRRHPTVLTAYAWPTVPGPGAWRRATLAEMRASNVLQPRVALTTLLPPPLAVAALRSAGIRTVLTPDPRVAARLGGRRWLQVRRLPSGAPQDDRRATYRADQPVIVFAGRAESVRGLDTLLAAFPQVRSKVPDAKLRLLLIPRPELPAILAAAGHADGVEVVTEPVKDLLAELAAAQVGTWPFKFDYTTSPPAMAVAEAMSVGLPVVATDVACVRAVLEPGVNGLAVPPADPAALASALTVLLRDEASWQRYADAGVRSVRERLGWDRAAAVTAEAYATALA
ncbi:glycosyl transferase family 1 [Krasilnikovia cinnamomea]|uniref:Glycosyl transferase family 1 n=1 Tax=Krasilnikovia cinnamomea TaxID=349313 RepID=A0A4Q7ZT55_9ACTN|nr:glycosyltransferase family 4 protein [Krasilnikovia cinnamomea]RZU54382.1 glycosyl transferase family 1 [Krasilnikovia cinnamomea]